MYNLRSQSKSLNVQSDPNKSEDVQSSSDSLSVKNKPEKEEDIKASNENILSIQDLCWIRLRSLVPGLENILLDCDKNDTMNDICLRMESTLGFPHDCFRLIFAGKEVTKDLTAKALDLYVISGYSGRCTPIIIVFKPGSKIKFDKVKWRSLMKKTIEIEKAHAVYMKGRSDTAKRNKSS